MTQLIHPMKSNNDKKKLKSLNEYVANFEGDTHEYLNSCLAT